MITKEMTRLKSVMRKLLIYSYEPEKKAGDENVDKDTKEESDNVKTSGDEIHVCEEDMVENQSIYITQIEGEEGLAVGMRAGGEKLEKDKDIVENNTSVAIEEFGMNEEMVEDKHDDDIEENNYCDHCACAPRYGILYRTNKYIMLDVRLFSGTLWTDREVLEGSAVAWVWSHW